MVKLRLQRHGSHKKPFYRVVATNSTSPRDGSFIEIIGTYDATTNPAKVELDSEKALKWLKNGAQPTDTVKSLLSKQGIIKAFKENKNN